MGRIYDIETGTELHNVEPLPIQKKYDILYVDPPYKFRTYDKKDVVPYPTMTDEELYALPVEQIGKPNSAMFMWVTNPKLITGINLMASWGYRYKTVAFCWVKKNKKADSFFFGQGYYTRQNIECLLLGTRGKPLKRESKAVSQIIYEPIREHSRKPDIVRDKIVQLFGDIPRIELFSREDVEGWDSWGFDKGMFNEKKD
jgi:N6-adenosine-specific RNA methylase IME4